MDRPAGAAWRVRVPGVGEVILNSAFIQATLFATGLLQPDNIQDGTYLWRGTQDEWNRHHEDAMTQEAS